MTTDAPPPPSRSRLLPKILAAILLLLISFYGTLQTGIGQDLLARALEQWLSTPNHRLSVHNLRGYLPWEMRIDRLSWGDREGVWLEMEQVALHWSLREGWQGFLHIHEASAERLRLHRQPLADPATEQPAPTGNLPLPALPAHLPALLVDRLQIAHLQLDAAAYGQTARFSLTGEIRHSRPDAGASQLLANLLLRPLDAGNTRLHLQARLLPAGPVTGESQLTLTLDGEERSGMIAAWSGLPQAKGMQLHLTGAGPLATWQGKLALAIEGVGGVQGGLNFHHADRSTLQFSGRAEAETVLIGQEWAAWLAPVDGAREKRGSVDLAWQVEWPDARHLFLKQLAITAPQLRLHGQGQWAWPGQQMQGTLQVEMPQLALFDRLLGEPLRGALATTLVAQGEWPNPHLQVTFRGEDLAMASLRAKQGMAEWTGRLQGEEGGGDSLWRGRGEWLGLQGMGVDGGEATWEWSADLLWPRAAPARLSRLQWSDRNLTAQLQGNILLGQRGGEGEWQVTVERLTDWVKRVAPGLPPVSGSGRWSGRFAVPPAGEGASPLLTATVTGGVASLVGLPVAWQELLGAQVQSEAKLAWWAGERLEVTDLDLRGEGLRWQGSLQADLGKGRMQGKGRGELPRLAPFSTLAGIPLQGGVEAEVQWEGAIASPHLEAVLQSKGVDIGRVHWENPYAQLTIDGLSSTPHGMLTLDLPDPGRAHREKSGTLRGRAAYRLEGSRLQLTDLHLPWPGGEVTGERVQLDLSRWLLDGRLVGKSQTPGRWVQWLGGEANPLPADLEGSLVVEGQLAGEGRRQNGEGTLELKSLRGGGKHAGEAFAQGQAGGFMGRSPGDDRGGGRRCGVGGMPRCAPPSGRWRAVAALPR
ncbi:MAG: hypothetical protein H7835_17550 [Magnetococcus sp. XQGC-1]